MTREAIRLNADKVKLHIARSGIPIKRLLDGMNVKTVHRIKAGGNTTLATAYKLASKLGVAVEELKSPVTDEDMEFFLPDQWLYDEAQNSGGIQSHIPFWSAIGGYKYMVGRSPADMFNPIEELLKLPDHEGRKIVLRRENHSFIFEIHEFHYSSDRERKVEYYRATACRFFPLARDGDTFSKAALSDLLIQYAWKELKRKALTNAEIVSIEGDDYPAHPHAYLPLVRFYQGSILKSIPLGARIFEHFQYDFKLSLIDYLESLPAERVSAKTTTFGISITVAPVRPAAYKLGWQEETLEIQAELVWRTSAGTLALAPWRQTHREQFLKGIASRDWRELYSRGMPLRLFPADGDDDPEIPAFSADPSLSAETIAAINAIARPDFGFF
jgi:hypothetical protein